MADVGESLDFLALLDEVADDTVSQLVSEMGPSAVSCEFGDSDALDMLSICDSTSHGDSDMASPSTFHHTAADDRHNHVQPTEEGVPKEKSLNQPSFPAAEPVTAGHNAVMVFQFKPSASAQLLTGQDARQRSLQQRRNRWHFSKSQRQQLDAEFKKNMYPSRWTITELSTDLKVPVHTLRVWFQNRRWRLRKSQGLSGNPHCRGSRTMLPDRVDITSGIDQQVGVANSSEPSSYSGSSGHKGSCQSTTGLPPLKPAVPRATVTIPSAVNPSPFISNPASSIFAPRPVYGDVERSMFGLNWAVPGLMAGWSLPAPSLYWPTGALRLPTNPYTYPFSPWQSYGLPVLPRAHTSDINPFLQRQDCLSEASMPQVVRSDCGSFFSACSSEDRLKENQYSSSAYAHDSQSVTTDHTTGHPVSSTITHTAKAAADQVMAQKSCSQAMSLQLCSPSVKMSTAQSTTEPKPTNKESRMMDSLPSASLSTSPDLVTQHTHAQNIVARSNGYIPQEGKISETASQTKLSAVPAFPAFQPVCQCRACMGSAPASTLPAWSGFTSPSSLSCPGEGMFPSPLFPSAINPTSSFSHAMPKVDAEVESAVALLAKTSGEAREAVSEKGVELHSTEVLELPSSEEEFEATEEESDSEELDVINVFESKEEDVSSTSDTTRWTS